MESSIMQVSASIMFFSSFSLKLFNCESMYALQLFIVYFIAAVQVVSAGSQAGFPSSLKVGDTVLRISESHWLYLRYCRSLGVQASIIPGGTFCF